MKQIRGKFNQELNFKHLMQIQTGCQSYLKTQTSSFWSQRWAQEAPYQQKTDN